MQAYDYNCTECGSKLDDASSLLQHFAQHVSQNNDDDNLLKNTKISSKKTRKKLPELLPINLLKLHQSIDDKQQIDPARFCFVTLTEDVDDHHERERQCDHCGKIFVWLSDFNQHISIDMNEKRFICKYCIKGFTKELKMHDSNCRMNNR